MQIPAPIIRRRARIEIIPLIDIMFFLLATFMIVSLSMIHDRGLKVNLPVAASESKQQQSLPQVITVRKSGDIFWNKDLVSLDGLSSRLSLLGSEKTDIQILIEADKETKFQSVVSVLDLVRKAGIAKVAIETAGSPGTQFDG